jgi:membrane-associated phospholipid phosphatase
MTPRPDMLTDGPWSTELFARTRLYFLFKAVGITAFTWAFFIAYFYVLRNPAQTPVLMPFSALDAWIPFEPLALYPYLSLWLYVGLAPGHTASYRELFAYGAWVFAMCVTGLTLFYLWPTAVPPRAPEISEAFGFALMQGVDAPGNACPSMHVAAATFSAICLDNTLWRIRSPGWVRLINLGWAVAIVWSTLATRQHVLLDAVAGALLGAAFAVPALRCRPAAWRLRADAKGATAIIPAHPGEEAASAVQGQDRRGDTASPAANDIKRA